MLNEEKMKMLISIGMFEKREGKRIFPACRYFKSDYIAGHMLRSLLGFTFCWLLGTAVVLLYQAESLLSALDLVAVYESAKMYLLAYGVCLAVYLVITWVVYARRYEYASRGLKVYVAKLKRLEKRYELQSRMKEQGREVRKYDGDIGV